MTSRRPSSTRSYKRRRGRAVSISAAPEPQQLLLLDNAVSLTLNGNMKASQMNACLVLLVVAVGLHCSYGEFAIGDNCTSSSDCDYSHGRCGKYDQCDMGTCTCDYGYSESTIEGGKLCQKLKRIGERCDVITDKCYEGTCRGVCTCDNSEHPSEDKKKCLGNSYGDDCDTKVYNYLEGWKTNTCESSKGLRCDSDTSKCLCVYGMKQNGDHCELYKFGETCDETKTGSDRKQCASLFGCIDNKCACSDTTKEHTFLVRRNGEETQESTCVDKDATLNLEESVTCEADYSGGYTRDKATVCGNYLSCGWCPEWVNQYGNNTKCLSGGADSVRTNVLASLSLVLIAFAAMLD